MRLYFFISAESLVGAIWLKHMRLSHRPKEVFHLFEEKETVVTLGDHKVQRQVLVTLINIVIINTLTSSMRERALWNYYIMLWNMRSVLRINSFIRLA